MSSKKTIRTEGSPSRIRGRLVEAIVAAMHEAPGVVVRQNVRLPPLSGIGRGREIDVLIDGAVVGYPIRVPIECKNEKEVIGVEKIDSFVGKLKHVGLAPQQAIFVSVNGFTRGALARAKAARVRTLVLTGLTAERLEATVLEAIHAVVYLWPVVTEWEVRNDIGIDIKAPEELGIYRNETGAIVGSVADLAWRSWTDGHVPQDVGIHKVNLHLPKGWRNVIAAKESVPDHVGVTFHVFGIVMSIHGSARRHTLLDAETRVVEKLQLKAAFDQSKVGKAEVFSDESELTKFIQGAKTAVQVIARVRLPRIQWMGVFWPLSLRVASALDDVLRPDETGKVPEVGEIRFDEIERPSFTNMWEPVWLSPLLKGILEAEFAPEDETITAKNNEVYATEVSDLDPILQSIQSRSVK